METRSLELSELVDRQLWLVELRWTAAASIAIIVITLQWLVGIDLLVLPLLAVAAVVALYNLAFWLYTRQRLLSELRLYRRAVLAANLQISLDLISLTVLLHFSGGVENPFFLYYIFHVIIASILLTRRATYLQATLAIGLFAGLVLAEYIGLLPHSPLPQLTSAELYNQELYVVAVLAAFTSTLYFAAFAATSITGGLRAREAQVIELKEALEREEKQLAAAYNKLQEVERLKSQYMRKVSHELRAPLSAIHSLITVVLQGLTGPLADKTREIMERASIRTGELLDMVADLLTLSRSREVQLAQVRKEISLADIAGRLLPLFQAEAIEKGIEMAIDVQPDLPTISADAEAMEELLSNLVSNAIKYTSAGGKARVELKATDGDNIVLTVSDTGIGIEPQEMPHIFDEFYRTKQAREQVQEGTGLGLPIVKAIVDAHGGRIAVDSKVGEGTTFVVTLPRVEGRGLRFEERGRRAEGEQTILPLLLFPRSQSLNPLP